MKFFSFVLPFSFFFFASCKDNKKQINTAFYYWKTTYHLDQNDINKLKQDHFNIIYLRLFDVDWDNQRNIPQHKATLLFNSNVDTGINYVPVVYITQNCLKKISIDSADILGRLIWQRMDAICRVYHINYSQLQLDADWTESTKEKFFALLKEVKKNIGNNRTLSCTIRLHQIKYPDKTGVPPVDRGMLMFYNMGQLGSPTESNSIYNEKTASQYTDYIEQYKLPLDIALPHYSWGILYRRGKTAALLNGLERSNLENPFFIQEKEGWYTVKAMTNWGNTELYAGDKIRLETADKNTCKDAWDLLKLHQKSDSFTLTFFDLKPHTDEKTIQSLYSIAGSSN